MVNMLTPTGKSFPTLQEIAKRVGVTDMTVSRVLSGSYTPKRADAVRRAKKIRRIAHELGYRPNSAAQSMREGRFGCIGLLMSTVGRHSVLEHMITGIKQGANATGVSLRFCVLADEELTDEMLISKLPRELAVDGLLVNYTHRFPPQLQALLEKYRIPAVWVNVRQDHDCVRADDFGSGALAVGRLAELGHRRIGYVTLEYGPRSHYSVQHRCDGYRDAMRRAGLSPNVIDYPSGLPNAERDNRLTAWLRETRPTAVHTQSLAEANAAYAAAQKLGLAVPGDLSILTINAEGTGLLGVELDALMLPSTQVGQRGVEMLTEKIADPRVRFGSEAVAFYFGKWKGHSCGPPAK
jgi:DNA-binding LacI/PurR family transcriptional regulator